MVSDSDTRLQAAASISRESAGRSMPVNDTAERMGPGDPSAHSRTCICPTLASPSAMCAARVEELPPLLLLPSSFSRGLSRPSDTRILCELCCEASGAAVTAAVGGDAGDVHAGGGGGGSRPPSAAPARGRILSGEGLTRDSGARPDFSTGVDAPLPACRQQYQADGLGASSQDVSCEAIERSSNRVL